jgi:hypothetical protein
VAAAPKTAVWLLPVVFVAMLIWAMWHSGRRPQSSTTGSSVDASSTAPLSQTRSSLELFQASLQSYINDTAADRQRAAAAAERGPGKADATGAEAVRAPRTCSRMP